MNAEQHLNSESHRVDFKALKLNKPVLYGEIIRVMEDFHRYKVESVTDEMMISKAEKWSRERSDGNAYQDQDCRYDYIHGMQGFKQELKK